MITYVIFLTLLSNTYVLLDHHWYVIGHKNDFQPNISDVCPHRDVSLSKGRVDPHTNCIMCDVFSQGYSESTNAL